MVSQRQKGRFPSFRRLVCSSNKSQDDEEELGQREGPLALAADGSKDGDERYPNTLDALHHEKIVDLDDSVVSGDGESDTMGRMGLSTDFMHQDRP